MKKRLAGLLLLLPMYAFADLVEVEIQARPNPNYYNPNGEVVYIVMRSVADETIVIKKVTVNRGNCKINAWDGYSRLKFGQSLRGVTYGCGSREIKEVVVKTDHGTETYRF